MSDLYVEGELQRELNRSLEQIDKIMGCKVTALVKTKDGTRDVYARLTKYNPKSYNNEELVASFMLTPLPGCNPVLISHSSYVSNRYRRMGIGSILHQVRLDACRAVGIKVMLCTVDSKNTPQTNLMTKHGWDKINEFFNEDTNNIVWLYSKNLENDQ